MRLRALLLAAFCTALCAQQQPLWEEVGSVRMNRAHVKWASPESLVAELRSNDATIRRAAVRAVGLGPDADVDPEGAVTEISLRYVSLGDSRANHAIIQVAQLQQGFVAIARQTSNGWERITVFECRVQYPKRLILDDLLQIEFAEHNYVGLAAPSASSGTAARVGSFPAVQLVLRTNGGGTFVFSENEERFELHGGGFRHVLSFVDRYDAFVIGSGGMTVHERRWFRDNQLVEAKTSGSSEGEGWKLEPVQFKKITCTPYKWDASSFKYIRSGPAHPCKYEPPK